MMLYTASWRARLDDPNVEIISISRSSPRGRAGYKVYTRLQPGKWFRDHMDEATWAQRYEAEILAVLDAKAVVAELEAIGAGRPVLLVCWEPPPPDTDFCHRGLVSRWFERELGLQVPEFGYEGCGCGAAHPKLPVSLRQLA